MSRISVALVTQCSKFVRSLSFARSAHVDRPFETRQWSKNAPIAIAVVDMLDWVFSFVQNESCVADSTRASFRDPQEIIVLMRS